MKTLVELFDTCQVENAIAGLRFKPEKIVFVGFKNIMTEQKTNALKNFFIKKGLSAEVYFEIVGRYDFDLIVNKFNYIIETYPECCFDLTGGKEIVLTAMGAVSASKNVPMFQFDVRSGKFINISGCENILEGEPSFMTIEEGIELNGCSVLHNETGDVNWDFNEEFEKDIEKMWSICKVHCGSWNRQANTFELLDSMGNTEKGIVLADAKDLFINNRIISDLIHHNLIYDYSLKGDRLTLKYKNSQIKKCLTKAGNILELYTYKILKEINREEPGYYDDIDLSIYIDWDGIVHSEKDLKKDTKNEVDIMVMRDLIPVFISCKNGEVHKEALYELDTVAAKFGGKYAKKYLFATYVSSDKESYEYLKQRARDMNIGLIDNLHNMTKEEIKKLFKKIVK